MDVGKAVQDVKAGKIDFKVDKYGIIHASVGKVSFDAKKLEENAFEVLSNIDAFKASCGERYVHDEHLIELDHGPWNFGGSKIGNRLIKES